MAITIAPRSRPRPTVRPRVLPGNRPTRPLFITPGDGERLLDRQAKKYLGMSGPEFRSKYQSGELRREDHPDVPRVALLLALGQP